MSLTRLQKSHYYNRYKTMQNGKKFATRSGFKP